jgi:transposase
MTEVRRQYTREFKLEAFRLRETSGKSAVRLERELGIGSGNLWGWKTRLAEDAEDAFPNHGRLAPEAERLRQLERENEILRQERDTPRKAVAVFSRPGKRDSSLHRSRGVYSR